MAISRFSGFYRAYEFAYGVAPNISPLLTYQGNAATGAQTVTVQTSYAPLVDGTFLLPLATTAPVTIGVGTNAETVTPSAVGNATFQNTQLATFTATFANLHGVGDPVTTGTCGLQEAINFASTAGGGVVIVDNAWTKLGGTTAMIQAATLPAGGTVSIMDNRSGAGTVQTAVFTLTNAQTLALNSAPVQLLPAPGATAAYDIIDMVLENVYATGAFAAGGAIQASYGTGTTVAATATVAATFLTAPTANQMIKVAGAMASTAKSSIANAAIYLAAATADFTTGAGYLKVWLNYRVLNGIV